MQFFSLFLAVALHKKTAVFRSQAQSLSQLEADVKSLAESRASGHKNEMEENWRRGEMLSISKGAKRAWLTTWKSHDATYNDDVTATEATVNFTTCASGTSTSIW